MRTESKSRCQIPCHSRTPPLLIRSITGSSRHVSEPLGSTLTMSGSRTNVSPMPEYFSRFELRTEQQMVQRLGRVLRSWTCAFEPRLHTIADPGLWLADADGESTGAMIARESDAVAYVFMKRL